MISDEMRKRFTDDELRAMGLMLTPHGWMTYEQIVGLGYPATAFGTGGIIQTSGYDINALNHIVSAQATANFNKDYAPGGANYRPAPAPTVTPDSAASLAGPAGAGGASQLKPVEIVGTDVTNPQGNWFGEFKDISKGAASGASAGSILGPVGAIAGAIIGGVVNALTGPNVMPEKDTPIDTGSAAKLAGSAGLGGASQLKPVEAVDPFWGPLEPVNASSLNGKIILPESVEAGKDKIQKALEAGPLVTRNTGVNWYPVDDSFWGPLEPVNASSLNGKIILPESVEAGKDKIQKALEAGPLVTRNTGVTWNPIEPDLAAKLAGSAGLGGAAQLKPVEVVDPMDYFGKDVDFTLPPYNYVPTIPNIPNIPTVQEPDRIPGVVTPAEKKSGKGKITPANVRQRVNRRSLFYGGSGSAGDVYIPTLIGY